MEMPGQYLVTDIYGDLDPIKEEKDDTSTTHLPNFKPLPELSLDPSNIRQPLNKKQLKSKKNKKKKQFEKFLKEEAKYHKNILRKNLNTVMKQLEEEAKKTPEYNIKKVISMLPTLREKEQLTSDDLHNLHLSLYWLIHQQIGNKAGKITGMLLEAYKDNSIIMKLVEDNEFRKEQIDACSAAIEDQRQLESKKKLLEEQERKFQMREAQNTRPIKITPTQRYNILSFLKFCDDFMIHVGENSNLDENTMAQWKNLYEMPPPIKKKIEKALTENKQLAHGHINRPSLLSDIKKPRILNYREKDSENNEDFVFNLTKDEAIFIMVTMTKMITKIFNILLRHRINNTKLPPEKRTDWQSFEMNLVTAEAVLQFKESTNTQFGLDAFIEDMATCSHDNFQKMALETLNLFQVTHLTVFDKDVTSTSKQPKVSGQPNADRDLGFLREWSQIWVETDILQASLDKRRDSLNWFWFDKMDVAKAVWRRIGGADYTLPKYKSRKIKNSTIRIRYLQAFKQLVEDIAYFILNGARLNMEEYQKWIGNAQNKDRSPQDIKNDIEDFMQSKLMQQYDNADDGLKNRMIWYGFKLKLKSKKDYDGIIQRLNASKENLIQKSTWQPGNVLKHKKLKKFVNEFNDAKKTGKFWTVGASAGVSQYSVEPLE